MRSKYKKKFGNIISQKLQWLTISWLWTTTSVRRESSLFEKIMTNVGTCTSWLFHVYHSIPAEESDYTKWLQNHRSDYTNHSFQHE